MKTRKAAPAAAKTNLAVSDAKPEETKIPSGTAEPETEKAVRFSFTLTDGGLPDFVSMRPKTKAQLRTMLDDEKVRQELGITRETATAIAEAGFDLDEANALLDLLSGAMSMGAAGIYKLPLELTSKAFQYTESQRAKINPPMLRVMNKWAPAFLKNWKDEIGLGLIFFAVTNAQVRTMHMMAREAQPKRPQPTALRPKSPEPKIELEQRKPEPEPVATDVADAILSAPSATESQLSAGD